MPNTGLEVWDKSVQTTNIWLDEIMDLCDVDRRGAWHILASVLRALRDRLPLEVAIHLGAQLPLLVRGTYFEQWHLSDAPRARTLEDFLRLVDEKLGDGPAIPAMDATGAVFRVLSHSIDEGQTRKLLAVLPRSLREFWEDAQPP